MDEPGTDALRKLAPSWTLAGDEQLLSILQNTHQRLLTKCQEANCQLEQMATALNDASISLQNVNNQFMALSSSQFIESRVYDDDELSTDVPVVKEQPQPEVRDELTSLKRSISVLENAHEIINILHDSDTESDTDDEMPVRMVLKPKDMYASRPLPYIIGSQPWKNKWHAGLLIEDSDSDSTASKVEHDSDQYSQSEPEDTHTDKLAVPHTQTTISETSSEPPSEQGSVTKPTPSDVASEIARRLGARDPPKMVEREPEDEEPPKPTARKIYRPQDPVSSTVFLDEPPPLSEHSDSQDSDIFADLHRSQPYARSHGADDLFGNDGDTDDGDIFSDFAAKSATNPSANPTSLFDSGPAPHMFVKHTENHHKSDDHGSNHRRNIHDEDHGRNVYNNDDGTTKQGSNSGDLRARGDEEPERGVKKPIGGISLFGNKGTESIGAAILKRNQRNSSTSGDDSGSDSCSESQSNQQIRKEKDIFDDLFARSESKSVTKDKDFNKDLKTVIQKKNVEKVKENKIEKPKVDLFSDNLFDDIDDIFSTNVVKMPEKDNSKSKSIFEDDDDLFSEIAAPKPMKIEVASSSTNKKSLFDSDDELFSENTPVDKPIVTPKPVEINKPKIDNKINEVCNKSKEINRSIFDDDDDELFSALKTEEVTQVQNGAVTLEKPIDFGREDTKNIAPTKTITNTFKSPSLFGEDEDEDETNLFAESAKSSIVPNVTASINEIAKLPSEAEKKIPEENVEILSSKTEVPKEILEVKTSSSVNTEETEEILFKCDDVNKDVSIPFVDKIVNTSETVINLKEEQSLVLPVNKNVDSMKTSSHKTDETNAAKIFDHIHKNLQNVEQSSSDTNNDYSDQDFDDLPPKIETNTNVIKNSETNTEAGEIPAENHNIFDKIMLEEDIDKLFTTNQHNTDNNETIFKTKDSGFNETLPNKTAQDNKTVEIATKIIEPDIFSNIFSEPPVFEKTKEPKRSKNVNALFDDDSDDESLFFKKNDPIFLENPEDFTPTQDRIFGLFSDEPPDDDMFSTIPKPKNSQNDNLPPIPDNLQFEGNASNNIIPEIEKVGPEEDIFNDLPKDEIKPTVEIGKESSLDIDEEIFKAATTESVDEQLFKVPTEEVKPTLKNKPDLFSESENLFTSGPKLEKPLKTTKEEVGNKNQTFKDNLAVDLLSDDESLFSSLPSLEKPTTITKRENENLASACKPSDDELVTSLQKSKSIIEDKLLQEDSKSNEDLFKKSEFIPKPIETVSETKPEKTDQKKVGKLKVGLNINVNALLPGASPKKVKPNDQPDGQDQNFVDTQKSEPKSHPGVQKLEPEKTESQNSDSKLIKAVSFDENPESDVLDNTVSKERAKIQVKRRPSTRRARREAVRKSAIDFGEDSTDNSSSIDDPPRNHTGREKLNVDEPKPNEIKQNIHKPHNEMKAGDTTVQAKIDPNVVEKQPTIEPCVIEKQPEITEKPSYSRDVKSKVVYILNDEDIFNTSPVEKKDSLNKNLGSNPGLTTLGKVYNKNEENNSKKDSKSSLFSDENDEEIFKAKTVVKKSTIFGSDSEDELFGTSKTEKKVEKREMKKEVVKGSLFGDDDDDYDDMFGVKTKEIIDQKPQSSRSTPKETPKPAEPVFEDPLSMFGDDG